MELDITVSARYGPPNTSPIYAAALELVKCASAKPEEYATIFNLIDAIATRGSKMLIGSDAGLTPADHRALVVQSMHTSVVDIDRWFFVDLLEWRNALLDIYIAHHFAKLDDQQKARIESIAPEIVLRIHITQLMALSASHPREQKLAEEEQARLKLARAIEVVLSGL